MLNWPETSTTAIVIGGIGCKGALGDGRRAGAVNTASVSAGIVLKDGFFHRQTSATGINTAALEAGTILLNGAFGYIQSTSTVYATAIITGVTIENGSVRDRQTPSL